jgi:3-oxoacyl-[acyl-carrier protein] reductase
MEITMTLRGKRALVTGASRGIGAAIAKTLVYEGADVAVTYEESAESAAEVVSAVKAKGRRGVAIQTDSADAAAVQASVDTAVAELGGLDILVNNAGILRLGELKDISLADIDALLNVNVRAPFIASKAALAHRVKGGRIITIGSHVADRVPHADPQCICGNQVGAGRVHEGAGAGARAKGGHCQPRAAGLYRHRHVLGKRPARGDNQTIHGIRSVWRAGGHRQCGSVPGVQGSIHTGSTLTVDGGANA